jgi:branched-chain amino acid transport system permease protein
MAYGAMSMLAAYMTYYLYIGYAVNPLLSLLLTIPIFSAFSCLVQVTLVKPIIDKSPKYGFDIGLVSLIVLFGLSILLEGIMLEAWTADPRAVNIELFGISHINILGLSVSTIKLVSFCCGVISTFVLFLFFEHTWPGRAIRAVSQNRDAAALQGVNVNYTYITAFAISGCLAALSGALLVMSYTIWASGYWTWTVKAFMIVTLGGVGSIFGTLIGAVLIGVLESVVGGFLPFIYSQVIGVIVLLLIIYLRPGIGLFGRKIGG